MSEADEYSYMQQQMRMQGYDQQMGPAGQPQRMQQRMPLTMTFNGPPGAYGMQNVYASQPMQYNFSPPPTNMPGPAFQQYPISQPVYQFQAQQVHVQYPTNMMPQFPPPSQNSYAPYLLSPVSPTYAFPPGSIQQSPLQSSPSFCIPVVQDRPCSVNIPNTTQTYYTVAADYNSSSPASTSQVYYKQPAPVKLMQATQVAPPTTIELLPSKREKKIIQIIDPKTGANVIDELSGQAVRQTKSDFTFHSQQEKQLQQDKSVSSISDQYLDRRLHMTHQVGDIPPSNIPRTSYPSKDDLSDSPPPDVNCLKTSDSSSSEDVQRVMTDVTTETTSVGTSQPTISLLDGSKVTVDEEFDDLRSSTDRCVVEPPAEPPVEKEETLQEKLEETQHDEWREKHGEFLVSETSVLKDTAVVPELSAVCEPLTVVESVDSPAEPTAVSESMPEQVTVSEPQTSSENLVEPSEHLNNTIKAATEISEAPSTAESENLVASVPFESSSTISSENLSSSEMPPELLNNEIKTVKDTTSEACITSSADESKNLTGVSAISVTNEMQDADTTASCLSSNRLQLEVQKPEQFVPGLTLADSPALVEDCTILATDLKPQDPLLDEPATVTDSTVVVVAETNGDLERTKNTELEKETNLPGMPVENSSPTEVAQLDQLPVDSLAPTTAATDELLQPAGSGGRGLPLSSIEEESYMLASVRHGENIAGATAAAVDPVRSSKSDDKHLRIGSRSPDVNLVRETRRRPRKSSKDQNMPDDSSTERNAIKVSSTPTTPDVFDVMKSPTATSSHPALLCRSLSSEPCLTDMERRKNRLNSGGCGESKSHHDRHKTPSTGALHVRQTTGDHSKSERSQAILRYDRDFLLALQSAPDSQHKPPSLPSMPEIILDKPVSIHGRQQFPPHFAAAAGLPFFPGPMPPLISPHNFAPQYTPRPAMVPPANIVMPRNMAGGRHHGSATRAEQAAAHGRKVITVSLQQAVQLHTVDNAWKPTAKLTPTETAVTAEQLLTEDLNRKLRGILNKLTPQKFQTLILQVNELQIDTEERLKGCINIVFEKAISEPSYSVAYANLAKCLVNLKVPMASNPLEMVTFRKLLLNRCQNEFEKDQKEEGDIARMQVEIDNATSDDVRRQLTEEKELAEFRARKRSLGNIRFIGELFKLKMLTEGIMHDCLLRLLRARDEDSLECLCGLLRTIGADLDNAKSRNQVDVYFHKINSIITKQKVSTRMKFMLQDVVELRNTNWVPRRDDNKPKTIQQIHNDAAAEEEQKSAMLRVASSPAIADRHSRQQRGAAGPTVAAAAAGPPRLRTSGKQPADESVQLGPHGRAAWQTGSSGGGRRTPSVESDRQPRFQLSASKGDEDHASHARSTSGAREMALHSIEKDRNAAIAAVRNISAGVNPTTSRGQDSPAVVAGPSTSCEASHEPVEQKLSAAELEKKSLSILEEYLELCDIQEAVACFRELDCMEFMDQFVCQAANHVIDKTSSARQLTGTLLFQLIATKLMSVDQLVDGLRELFSMAEDIEIDVPKIWLYLAELISPMIQPDHCLPLNFLYRASESVRHSRKVSGLIANVLQDAAHRLGRPAVAEIWHTSGMNWSMFVPAADVNAFLHAGNLIWIEMPAASCTPVTVPINDPMSQMYKIIVDASCDVDTTLVWIRENIDPVFRRTMPFVRAVTTAVCSSAVIGADRPRYEVSKDEVKKRAGLLSAFIGEDCERQLQAIYAIQAFVHRIQHPPDVLRNLFDVFYDEDIISEESFHRWRTTNEPAEQGKGVAITSVIQFFRWLDESGTG